MNRAKASLTGRRILVPTARVGANVLAHRLRHAGADAVAFPRVVATPPSDRAPLDQAVTRLGRLHRVVAVGRIAAEIVVRRSRHLARPPRVVAVGAGAVAALRRGAIVPAAAPELHTPDGIAREIPVVPGARVLVLHAESTPPVLANALRRQGLEVEDVAAYRLEPVCDRGQAAAVFGEPADALAFANPSTVRILMRLTASLGLDLERCLPCTPVAAVGPETAREARRWGLEPDLVGPGSLAALIDQLAALMGSPGRGESPDHESREL